MVSQRNSIVATVIRRLTTMMALVIVVSSAQITKSEDKNTLFGLPFLDISNGRVRVNFAGYHAEAGLGGLLGNSAARTAGGLYAGAGTPFGAHASAGLGGTVNGADNAGGLLQARAGLGNGGPEAAAGLGGNLDGVDPTQSRGVLWKSTSRGGGTTQITSKSVLDNANGNDGNIQKIPASKTTQLRIGSLSDPLMLGSPSSNAQFVQRRDVSSSDEEKLNVVVEVTRQPPTTVYYSPTRRCQRKRLCRGFSSNSRKTVVQSSSVADTAADAPGPAPQLPAPAIRPRARTSTTLFDDIFNIPISTLAAVNQLLNNKAKQQYD